MSEKKHLFDWQGLQKAALSIGITPTEFWNLSPRELFVLIKPKDGQMHTMTKENFNELQKIFPDQKEK